MTYTEWKNKYPEALIMIAESSSVHITFYCAYDFDAITLHDVTGYKIHQNRQGIDRCGGPNFMKMAEKLRMANISYRVVTPSRVIEAWDAETNTQRIQITIEDYPQRLDSILDFMNENGIVWEPKDLKRTIVAQKNFPEKPSNVIPNDYHITEKTHPIRLGDIIRLVNNDGEVMDVLLEATTFGFEYVSAGGPYEDATVRKTEHSNAGGILDDGTIIASSESPIGKALLGKKEGDSVNFTGPTGERFSYYISDIFNKQFA